MPGKSANKKDRKFKKNDKLTGILEKRKIIKKDQKRENEKEQNATKREKEKTEKKQALSKLIEDDGKDNLVEIQEEYTNFLDDVVVIPLDIPSMEKMNATPTILSPASFEKWKTQKTVESFLHIVKSFAYIFEVSRFSSLQLEKKVNITNAFRNDIIQYCLTELPAKFTAHLRTPEQIKEKAAWLPSKGAAYKEVAHIVREFIHTVVILVLEKLNDETMMEFVLKRTLEFLPYFGAFVDSYLTLFLRKLLSFWGHNSETIRTLAYLNIRALALQMPYPFINNCLKGIYLTFISNSKFLTLDSFEINQFMFDCVLDVYSIDAVAAYQHGYHYVRHVSIQLRQVFLAKDEERESVCNWQMLNAMRFWVRLLCKFPHDKPLWNLALWITQIIHGLITLSYRISEAPFRLELVKLLNEMVEARSLLKNPDNALFINSVPYLVEILKDKYFATQHKNIFPLNQVSLYYQHQVMESKTAQDYIFSGIMSCLATYFKSFASSIAFPELTLPTIVMLKRVRDTLHTAYRNKIDSFLEAVEENNKFIIRKRDVVSFSPHEKEKVNLFIKSCTKCPFVRYCNQLVRNETFDEEISDNSAISESDDDDSDEDDDNSDEDDEQESDDEAIALLRDEFDF